PREPGGPSPRRRARVGACRRSAEARSRAGTARSAGRSPGARTASRRPARRGRRPTGPRAGSGSGARRTWSRWGGSQAPRCFHGRDAAEPAVPLALALVSGGEDPVEGVLVAEDVANRVVLDATLVELAVDHAVARRVLGDEQAVAQPVAIDRVGQDRCVAPVLLRQPVRRKFACVLPRLVEPLDVQAVRHGQVWVAGRRLPWLDRGR